MADFKVSAERVELFDHPTAERLEIAKVGMFSLVVAKGHYKDGDVVVFAPKRSVLPEEIRDRYKNEETGLSYLRRGAIVRSIRLRGELSEGVLLDREWVASKLDALPPNRTALREEIRSDLSRWVGQDIANDLGIVEDVPELPAHFVGVAAAVRADRFAQHDVEGIRIHSREFEEGEPVIVSEKLHGLQINVIFHEDGFVEIGSKGLLKKGVVLEEIAGNIYWQAFNNSGLREIIGNLFPGEFVQVMGEVIPAQKGFSYGCDAPTVRVFRLEVDGVRLSPIHISSVAKAHGWMVTVPKLADLWVPFTEMGYNLTAIEELAKGREGISGKGLHIKEGVVVEPLAPRLAHRGNFPLYLKVINPKFKEDDEALS